MWLKANDPNSVRHCTNNMHILWMASEILNLIRLCLPFFNLYMLFLQCIGRSQKHCENGVHNLETGVYNRLAMLWKASEAFRSIMRMEHAIWRRAQAALGRRPGITNSRRGPGWSVDLVSNERKMMKVSCVLQGSSDGWGFAAVTLGIKCNYHLFIASVTLVVEWMVNKQGRLSCELLATICERGLHIISKLLLLLEKFLLTIW